MLAKPSHLESAFELWLNQTPGVGHFTKEYRFLPTRNWRFDFAWTLENVAVEIDGLRYDGVAGHQTVKGVMADAEKYEAALRMGWKVYRVPGPWIAEGERLIWRPQVMETLKALLRVA